VSRGLTESVVDKMRDYEHSDLPERTKAALRFADRLAEGSASADKDLYEDLRGHFTDDQILDLGMTAAFMFGWQRFIEAFGIVPDRWQEGAVMPWEAPDRGEDAEPA
jgi:alkylhydroperoxidase family enzyme